MSEQNLGHENFRPGFKYHTTKWDCNIIDLYELLWDDLKGKDISILEFGIYYGESLRYWKEFFHPDSLIIGVDKDKPKWKGEEFVERLKDFTIELCDQSYTNSLERLVNKYPSVDIVVDDGAHHAFETENTFRALWTCVNPNGWYVIEDCCDEEMKSLARKLLQEVIDSKEGKGVFFESFRGFGEIGSSSPTMFIKKSGSFTGLIR